MISTHSNCICILVLTTMKMTTWVAVTGMWLLCNKITFIYPRSFVGFWNKIINWQYAVCNWQYSVCNSVSFWRLLSSSDTKFAEKTGALALLVYNVWASFACVNDPLLRLMWLLPLLFSPHVPVIQLIAIRSLV